MDFINTFLREFNDEVCKLLYYVEIMLSLQNNQQPLLI